MIHYCANCSKTLAEGEGVAVEDRLPLTVRQRAIVDYLADSIHRDGFAPSFDEIASHFGYRSLATVHEHLTNLERKGWLRRRYNEPRSIRVVEAA